MILSDKFNHSFQISLKSLRLPLLSIFSVVFFLLSFSSANAQQNVSIEEFKAAFIFHLFDKVKWQNEKNITTYKLAIVGDEQQLVEHINAIARKKKVKGKSVTASLVNSIEGIADYHMILINKDAGLRLDEVANKTRDTNTLLVTRRN